MAVLRREATSWMQESQGTFFVLTASKEGRPGEEGAWEHMLERKGSQ